MAVYADRSVAPSAKREPTRAKPRRSMAPRRPCEAGPALAWPAGGLVLRASPKREAETRVGRVQPAPPAKAEDEAAVEGAPAVPQIIPKDKDEAAVRDLASHPASAAATRRAAASEGIAHGVGKVAITTVLRPRKRPETFLGKTGSDYLDRSLQQAVAPSGAPTQGAAASVCLPAHSTLAWNVVSADADNWGVNVQSLTLAGQVNVKPWPSHPTSTVVPNTVNPVDGGNITQANFQPAIDDMTNYHTVGGGAGPNWHSTSASSAHEWAHWDTDWIADSTLSAAGGNWPQANTALDALREPKATSPMNAAAQTALTPRVDARFATFRTAVANRWNAIPDSPGVAGSTGYDAGAVVLAGLIGSVRTYATAKGWLGAPATPNPAPNPAPNPGP
jgi:hypothetical protein